MGQELQQVTWEQEPREPRKSSGGDSGSVVWGSNRILNLPSMEESTIEGKCVVKCKLPHLDFSSTVTIPSVLQSTVCLLLKDEISCGFDFIIANQALQPKSHYREKDTKPFCRCFKSSSTHINVWPLQFDQKCQVSNVLPQTASFSTFQPHKATGNTLEKLHFSDITFKSQSLRQAQQPNQINNLRLVHKLYQIPWTI